MEKGKASNAISSDMFLEMLVKSGYVAILNGCQ